MADGVSFDDTKAPIICIFPVILEHILLKKDGLNTS